MSAQVQSESEPHDNKPEIAANGAVIRFAGDSGDGVQLTGQRFTNAVVLAGNDVATLPDFPSEIRAPAGTLYGVSGFQLQFASKDVFTPGDSLDVLVALNAAALQTNLPDLKTGGLLVVDTGALGPAQLKKAGYTTNPLEDGSLSGYQVVAIDISTLTRKSVMAVGLSTKEAGRCKNFWTLGLILSVYGRSVDSTLSFIAEQFKKRPEYVEANSIALKAGYAYASSSELFHQRYRIVAAPRAPGLYRNIDGNTALAYGLIAGSICAESAFSARRLSNHASKWDPARTEQASPFGSDRNSSRGRDCRCLFGGWSRLCRSRGRLLHERARHGSQNRSNWPGGSD